MYEINAVNHQ